MEVYYAAACQVDQRNPQTRKEMGDNTSNVLRIIEQTVTGYAPVHPVRLLAFPEFAHAAPIYDSAEELL